MNIISPSTGTPKVVNAVATASDATIYTVATGKAFVLKAGAVCNTSAFAATFFLSVCPSGGTVANGRVVAGFSVPANDTLPLTDYIGGMMLDVGDFISIKSGTASVLDVVLSGVELA